MNIQPPDPFRIRAFWKPTHASSLVQTLRINLSYFLFQVSSIQSNIKSLESKITECTENEEKALAECKTLQEAVKNENALECSLREKDNHIKELESEVCSCLTLANNVSGSGTMHKDSRLYLKTKISMNAFSKTLIFFTRRHFKTVFTVQTTAVPYRLFLFWFYRSECTAGQLG